MDDKTTEAAYHGAREDAPLFSLEQTCQAQGREGHQIVQQHGLPAPGVCAVKDQLEQPKDKAGHQPRPQAPADGEEDDGEHGRCQ